jgi:hypothetical protein
MDEEELGLVLDGIGLNTPFWVKFIMGLDYSLLVEFEAYEEKLHQVLKKFIEDGKQCCDVFFQLLELFFKHLSLKGNATISSLAQFLLTNRSKRQFEEFELHEIANRLGEDDILSIENAPHESSDENGASSRNEGRDKPADMPILAVPEEPEELKIAGKGEGVKLLETETAHADQGESA